MVKSTVPRPRIDEKQNLSEHKPQLHFNGLSANALKLIALFAMTVDHIGLTFFEDMEIFRIIGRISFPIFAYMIAEGCRYTRNRRNYFLRILLLGLLCQIVYFVTEQSLYQGALITLSLSILQIFTIQWAKQQKNGWWLPVIGILLIFFGTVWLPTRLSRTDFNFDYGFCGVLLPVWISLSDNRRIKLILMSVGLVALNFSIGAVQWWSLLALPIIALYNGRRGKYKMKYLFYIYYPLHLAIIYLVDLVISAILS